LQELPDERPDSARTQKIRYEIEGLLLLMDVKAFRKHGTALLLMAILVATAFSLSPMLASGYYNDDSINSMTSGVLSYSHTSLIKLTTDVMLSWISMARLYPFASYCYAFFYLVNSLLLYKSLLLFAVLVDIAIFYHLVKKLTRSVSTSMLSALVLSLLFQFRIYHDPILSYQLLLELIFFLTMVSLLLFTSYLENGRKRYLLLSLTIYFVSLLTYEITYVFFLLFLVIACVYPVKRSVKRAIRPVLPFVAITLACGLFVVFLRMTSGIMLVGRSNGSAYVPNIDPLLYIYTLARQTSAAFPLSYFSFSINDRLLPFIMGESLAFYAEIAVLVVIYFLLFMAVLKKVAEDCRTGRASGNSTRLMFVFGGLLLILPGLIISSSPKYQKEITWGTGYLPVFISYFGIALMLALAIGYILNRIHNVNNKLLHGVLVLLAFMLTMMVAINFIDNHIVVENQNQQWLYPRAIMEEGMRNGVLNDVPDGALMVVGHPHYWDMPEFFLVNSNIFLKDIYTNGEPINAGILPSGSLISREQDRYVYTLSQSDPVYYLQYGSEDSQHGYVVFAHINQLSCTNDSIITADAGEVKIYVKNGGNITVSGNAKNANGNFECFSRLLCPDITNPESVWKEYTINATDLPLDLQSLSLQYYP
jgi:hypothetical protein